MNAIDSHIRVRQKASDAPILLSICIPTYNRSRSLDELLDSLWRQSTGIAEGIEIVISDNASTDGTPNVIDSYVGRFPNLVVNRWGENTGTRYNVCNVPRFASGKYVWFLFDDDVLEEGAVPEVFDFIERKGELALVSLNWKNGRNDAVYQDFENKVYCSAEGLFAKCGEYMALGSALLVMRSLYLTNLTDADEQLWFPHFIVSMRGVGRLPCGYYGKPLIRRRVVDKPTWHAELPYIWLIDYPRSVLSLSSYGYDVSRLQASLEVPWQRSFLGQVIEFKKQSRQAQIGVPVVEFCRINSFRRGFYSQILPLTLLPSFFYQGAAHMVRSARHISRLTKRQMTGV